MISVPLLLSFSAAVVSYFCTRLVRSYVIRKNVLDIPNERSSHQAPTPRGGGLAVVFTIAMGGLIAIACGQIERFWLIPLAAALVISALGWWDDTKGLSAGIRLVVQILTAVAAILALQLFIFRPWTFTVLDSQIPAGAALVFFILFAVWMTNLYNFMDGIDGILGLQSLTVAIAAAILIFRAVGFSELATVYLLAAGSAAGFLVLNWSPARIFMGDVGSAALGFFFAILAMIGVATGQLSFVAVVVLHAMFIGDATITLFVRFFRGKKPHQAHRSHFYQKMVQAGFTHAQVSILFGVVNVVWLLPVAWLHEIHRIHALPALGLASIPVVILCLRFKAGMDAPDAVSKGPATPN